MTEHLITAATCLGCGCTCDDIDLLVRDDRIVEARRACELGIAWFGDGRVPSGARVDGRDVAAADAIDAAATLLTRAARPLVYLAPDVSCETQRETVALADTLRAMLDSVTSSTAAGAILASQARGRAGATLGEVRNRADVLLFWAVDPAARYPRFWSRYAPEPAGLHVPNGRRSRTVVAVDVGDARGPADADVRISIAAGDDVAVLTALTASVLRYKPDPTTETLGPVRDAAADDIALEPQAGGEVRLKPDTTGDREVRLKPDTTSDRSVRLQADDGTPRRPDDAARELADALVRGRYVVVVADGEPDGPRDPDRAEALLALGHALNGPTRGAVVTLRGGGNRTGADAVLTAQTGYPMAVDFARGYPRYAAGEATIVRAARGDIDAALVVGAAAGIPRAVQEAIGTLPGIVIGPRATGSPWRDRGVAIDTGVAGIHEPGTALRLDDVPLPLRPSVAGPPATVDVVRQLLARMRTR